MLRDGKVVTTSQITPARYMEYMEPILAEGKDVLFICLSSGVSGAFSSSQLAARELAKKFPERKVIPIDSKGASLGEGLLTYYAVSDRAAGMLRRLALRYARKIALPCGHSRLSWRSGRRIGYGRCPPR